ncbi:MAG: RsmE family RNA methyltransferase [Isosphaeraceae bacterium]
MSVRFYCPDPPQDGCFQLPADEARHLARVCRHVPGDRVELFDGKGFATIAMVKQIGPDRVLLVAEGPPLADPSPRCSLTLATAIPKGERFDWLVEKATELGVHRLIPLLTERSVVDPRLAKIDRLRRASIEAAKQARRSRLLILENPWKWADLVGRARHDFCFLAQPGGLSPALWPGLAGAREVLLAIGPEGGFSSAEEDLALAAGWQPISLNQHILRIETAALAGAVLVLTRCEEHGTIALD